MKASLKLIAAVAALIPIGAIGGPVYLVYLSTRLVFELLLNTAERVILWSDRA